VFKTKPEARQKKRRSVSCKRFVTGLGSPKPARRAREEEHVGKNKLTVFTSTTDQSESEESEVSVRMGQLNSLRGMDRLSPRVPATQHDNRSIGDSQSDMGSTMSNLSIARQIPNRKKRDENATKIQAIARGYIQRLLYRSLLALEQTKKKFRSLNAITIQAQVRGYLQRMKGPRIQQIHNSVPLRERIVVEPSLEPIFKPNNAKSVAMHEQLSKAQKKQRKERKNPQNREGRHTKKEQPQVPEKQQPCHQTQEEHIIAEGIDFTATPSAAK